MLPAETTTTAASGETTTTEAAVESAMTLTVDINPDAVWSDGTPITAADFDLYVERKLEHTWVRSRPSDATRSCRSPPARVTSR